jgi:sulfonate transport system permease protein
MSGKIEANSLPNNVAATRSRSKMGALGMPGRLLRALVIPAVLLIAWQWLSQQGPEYAYIFVPLTDIGHSFLELLEHDHLALQIVASLTTALKGLLFGGLAGLALALLMSAVKPVDAFVSPLFNALRQIPNVALIPLIVLWFGNSDGAKVLVVSLSVFEVVTLNTYEGLHAADRRLIEVGHALTLNPLAIFRYIRLPAALPSICTGMQHAIAFAWLSTVAAELLFVIGPGLGTVMQRGELGGRMDTVIVCLVFVSLLGFAIHQASIAASRRLLRWRQTAYS